MSSFIVRIQRNRMRHPGLERFRVWMRHQGLERFRVWMTAE